MWQTFKSWFQALVDFLYRLLLTVFDFVKDVFFFFLENLMLAAVFILDQVSAGLGALNPLQYVEAIPEETQSIMALCGFNECMAMIVAALLIRVVLQLIPFVRLGS